VGKADENVTARFGPGTWLSTEAIEAFIGASRAAIGDESANVEVGFRELKFASGTELLEFLQETSDKIEIDPSDVQR
jgi:hypothetical protein